jgi:hypothetical protein
MEQWVSVEKIHRLWSFLSMQIREMLNVKSVPEPDSVSWRHWPDGWNLWKPVPSEQVLLESQHILMHPNETEMVHAVGSDLSMQQGWANGALQVSDMVLNKAFGIKPLV